MKNAIAGPIQGQYSPRAKYTKDRVLGNVMKTSKNCGRLIERSNEYICKSLTKLTLAAVVVTFAGFFVSQCHSQIMDTPAEQTQRRLEKEIKPPQSYQVSSRIHLQEGQNTGYLVVKVELQKGMHIYSLSQAGKIPPTKLSVAASKQFRLTGKFSPDKPAKVVAVDPVFSQRVEKHHGVVQFFAPIEIAPGVDRQTLATEVKFDGQVCGGNSCVPVRGLKVKGAFAGFFGNQPKASVAEQAKPSTTKLIQQ